MRPALALGLLLALQQPRSGATNGAADAEAELRGLKLGALSKQAVARAVDAQRLEDAQNADDPREAVLQLLLADLVVRRRAGHLNSKTPYDAGLERRLLQQQRAESSRLTAPQQCEPLAAYGVLRHGTRYPTAKDRKKMAALGGRLRVREPAALPASLGWLDGWTPPAPEEEDGTLHEIGYREHHALAQRLQSNYPTLFPPSPHHKAYAFSATAKPRTQQSAQAFAAGLAGLPPAQAIRALREAAGDADADGEGREGVLPPELLPHAPMDEDRLLRFHSMCRRYQVEVKENSTLDAVKGGDPGKLLLAAVGRRVAKALAKAGVTLAAPDADQDSCDVAGSCSAEPLVDSAAMKAIWKACQWETLHGTDPSRSNWCSLIGDEGVVMMETLGDLDMFWEKGPGLRLPSLMACELLQDVAAKLGKAAAVAGTAEKDLLGSTTTLRFAHAETVVPLLGILGVIAGQTVPLRMPEAGEVGAEDVVAHLAGRSWRMSELSPMAANVLLVLHRCGGDSVEEAGQLFVSVLHNEVPVALPGCAAAAGASDGGSAAGEMQFLCPWDGFLDAFKAELTECTLDEICALTATEEEAEESPEKVKTSTDEADEQAADQWEEATLQEDGTPVVQPPKRISRTDQSTRQFLFKVGCTVVLGLLILTVVFCVCVVGEDTNTQERKTFPSHHAQAPIRGIFSFSPQ